MKTAVREMWSLEYEVDELQSKFSESIGTLDLDNLDVDFIEDMMLKAKPLQSVLNDIRVRQNSKLAEVGTENLAIVLMICPCVGEEDLR